jgi:tRNA-splicing ligase RtcB (3'-phosphate/5'-hydroxy nucleic acid ligase)
MITKKDFRHIDEYLWEIPATFRPDMRVPARIYADEALLETALTERCVEQLINTATLPGIVQYALAMPDIHQGYGFPIGGVAATRLPHGIISPGGVGYDINCGVRLMGTHLIETEISPYLGALATALYQNCPSGVGEKGSVPLRENDLEEICVKGARWALSRGFARKEDLQHTEEFGCLAGADPSKVSQRARDRGRPQLGTLGAGNHFIEVDVVTEIYDQTAAEAMGLFEGQITAQIHCGSRGFGHQICTDYVSEFQSAVKKYDLVLPDRELVCAPFDSPEGQSYYGAMVCAANYAFANRQVLLAHIRRSFEQALAGKVHNWDVFQIYDIAHNMAKIETHKIDGQPIQVCVHRKGATRAFGPGFEGLPPEYQAIGQPVLVPGSMGTASYVLVGTAGSMAQTFGSTCHGAGRVMSRAKAKHQLRGEKLRGELEHQGIVVRAGSMSGLAEEAPTAYKDVDRVVEVVHRAGIARKVARLEPLAVIKG